MPQEVCEQVKQICILMDGIIDDHSVPRNIRTAVSESKDRLMKEISNPEIALASAIYKLDEVANDINMPFHARSSIWSITSELERLKEEIKA